MRAAMLAVAVVTLVWAQTPAFEVASVKLTSHGRTADGWSRSSIDVPSPGRLEAVNASMQECLRWAFDVKDYQIAGPPWLNDDDASYDIEAKAPEGTPHEELHKMMQTLLAERFKLTLHRQQKTLPVYELVVAKGGPKLEKAKDGGGRSGTNSTGGHVVATGISMLEWAYQLSRYTKMPVFDKTGLAGKFDFKLDYSPDERDDPARPNLSTALQEQLGLKLHSAKGPVDRLVIEHVERVPTAN